MKKIASLSLLGLCACWSHAVFAQSGPQASVDVSVGGSVASNPFLYEDGKAAGSMSVNVAPQLIFEDEVSRTVIGGNLRLAQYTNRYGTDIAGRLQVSDERLVDERTTLRIGASVLSSRSALQDGLLSVERPQPGPGPLLPPVLPPIDTTIAGTRSRVTSLNASIGVSYSLDEVSSINLSTSLSAAYFGNDVGFDYRTIGTQLGYQRKLSDRTSINIGVQGSLVDYLGRTTGDSRIVSPTIGVQHQLSDRISVSASAGVSNVRTDVGPGGHREVTSFAGSLGICNENDRQSMCLSASRSAQPTALGGVSTVSSIAAVYNFQASSVDRFSLAARYGKTDQRANSLSGFPIFRVTEIVGASGSYSRELNDRLTLSVTPSYSKIYDAASKRDANFALMVNLTMRFGTKK